MNHYFSLIEKNPEYFGINNYCNICGYRFSKFKLFNDNNPREAKCPLCGSLERHRHLYVHLSSLFPFLKKKKILHFAPEKIIKKVLQESEAEYFDADIIPERATYQIDITSINFDNNYFDYIICIHVLEHIIDDIKAMNELYRVLKIGGVAFLSVPIRKTASEDYSITEEKEREKLFGQSDHVRAYSLELFLERLNKVGFNTEFISNPLSFPSFLKSSNFSDFIILARKV